VSVATAIADAAYQGEAGAYSEQAAWILMGRDAALLPCVSLADVFDAVRQGRARTGVVPVENSLAGTVPRAYELLLDHDLTVAGETTVHIDHVLIGRPGRAFFWSPANRWTCRRARARRSSRSGCGTRAARSAARCSTLPQRD